jgi:hypothetical protein
MTVTSPGEVGHHRKVSLVLGIGIFLLPIVFVWFLLRKGHSTPARILGFGWLALTLVIAFNGTGSSGGGTQLAAADETAPQSQALSPGAPESATAIEAAAEEEAPPAPKLTGPQMNAVRSAKQYLSFSGFSRDGLIQQLSSDAGDGYDVADATAAVDSLDADWNENAAKSAQQYLNMTGFSCDGLIEQLSSSAGDKYTVSQAAYGARQAGACS